MDWPKEYRSLESMEAITGEDRELTYTGTRVCGRRRYVMYEDKEGMGWYKTQILTEEGWLEEKEAVFGKRKSRWTRG